MCTHKSTEMRGRRAGAMAKDSKSATAYKGRRAMNAKIALLLTQSLEHRLPAGDFGQRQHVDGVDGLGRPDGGGAGGA